MLKQDNVLIGQLLVDEGIITPQQLEASLNEQKKTSGLICTTIVKLGYASEEKVFSLLSRQLKIPYIKIKSREILRSVIEKVSAKFASHYKVIPLELTNNVLMVAIADPLDVRTLDDLRLLLGYEIKAVMATESEIRDAIQKYYGVGAETLEQMVSEGSGIPQEIKEASEKVQDLEALAEDASIIKFVNQILAQAVRDRATDVHLEPFENELRTRFRIDGILYNIHTPETIKFFHQAIVSRIKIMASMNIAERRLPQDGRIKIKIDNQELDLRVSTLPTSFGEGVHIRILNVRSFLELEKLGLYSEDLNIIERMIKKPHGIILVTGPTGSGKSTTLYACLSRLNSTAVKVITIEDPVEYQLKGINQMQVNPKIGFDFATGLRHILRHDPNIIMIGEIRDLETAEIAIRSALTGHLVFSTLHTNDAAGGITRLLDMGIEPFLISSSIECLIAQRLVRLICPHCRVPVEPRKEILDQIKDLDFSNRAVKIYEGKGCKACRFTGYQGRTGIYEILVVTEEVRELILARVSSQQIKQRVLAQGMRTLRQDGLRKVLEGLTTINEVIRVTQQETA